MNVYMRGKVSGQAEQELGNRKGDGRNGRVE